MPRFDRRQFLESVSTLGVGGALFPGVLYAKAVDSEELTVATIAAAEEIAGLSFTAEQREMMLASLQGRLESYERLRAEDVPNSVPPALVFDPTIGTTPPAPLASRIANWEPPARSRPASDETLAFLSVAELAGLLKSRQVTSVELTRLYLDRLKKSDGLLHAVVTLMEERALRQAEAADAEIAAGGWRGPLHGIPWGAKDLLTTKGYPTTWGAMPYRDQVLDEDATVVQRLDAAGAVLIAKLTLGALAMGDVWYGGTTRNPWNLDQGSSGSSAGPGSAVAAGMVGFAIGSETLGSIVSPSTRNGVTGLRPTFGRVSRHGAMALSWSMDKLGPMARTAEDCALIFDAIHGYDAQDPTTRDAAFTWPTASDLSSLRIGYLADAFEADYGGRDADHTTLAVLRRLGADLQPITLPDFPARDLLIILFAEAATAFDDLTRSPEIDTLVRQSAGAWPNYFRSARFIPAVEYLRANRIRTQLMQAMHTLMADLDVFVSPSFGGNTLTITNLTGHPAVVVPNRFSPLEDDPASPRRQPGSISFIGGLYQDDRALAVAHAYQQATDFHRQRPPMR